MRLPAPTARTGGAAHTVWDRSVRSQGVNTEQACSLEWAGGQTPCRPMLRCRETLRMAGRGQRGSEVVSGDEAGQTHVSAPMLCLRRRTPLPSRDLPRAGVCRTVPTPSPVLGAGHLEAPHLVALPRSRQTFWYVAARL